MRLTHVIRFLGHSSIANRVFCIVDSTANKRSERNHRTWGRVGKAGRACVSYTANAGEHFSLPAFGSDLAVPRILFGTGVVEFALPVQN